jgi:hypothetical protein
MNKLLFTTLLSISVCSQAETLGQPQLPVQPEIITVPTGTSIPMLDIIFECSDCKPDPKMKALIYGAYVDQAELEKATIDYKTLSTLKITKFTSRGKARFFLGALAGRDHILGSLECHGRPVEVSDTAISAVNGIESVALNVGKDAYKSVLSCVLNPESQAQ